MAKYKEGEKYANSGLAQNNKLLDNNTLNAANVFLIKYTANPKILILNRIGVPVPLSSRMGKVDTVFYQFYEANDLRKTIFF